MREAPADHRRRHLRRFVFITFALLPLIPAASSINGITPTQPLTANETLVSAGEEFELGFFSPGRSNFWYIGIWYKKIHDRTVVWVANRDSPLRNSSGAVLKVDAAVGSLVLVDGTGKLVWSSTRSIGGGACLSELLDNGNLVLRRENDQTIPDGYLWQSFDYPTDTLLPGMKLGWDNKTGLCRFITSWRTGDDPASGNYSFRLDGHGYPEIYLRDNRKIIYRSGPWDGLGFSGVPEMDPSPFFSFQFVTSPDEVFYSFNLKNNSVYSRLVVKHSGILQRFTWIPNIEIWSLYWYAPKDQCDVYRDCGVSGICDTNTSPVCRCLTGFRPKYPTAWKLRDGSGGCVRDHELDCKTDGFVKMNSVKLPESGEAFVDKNLSLGQCRDLCRKNCSCRGFASWTVAGGGSGCVIWINDLYDIRQFAPADSGEDFYLRVPASDLGPSGATVGSSADGDNDSNKNMRTLKVVGIVVGIGVVVSGLCVFIACKRSPYSNKALQRNILEHRGRIDRSEDILANVPALPSYRDCSFSTVETDDLELPMFDFSTLVIATNEFCDENKLGKGGFGSVYKGILGGEEVAVKRLSRTSGQGLDEFKNEVKLIARLQHRNLVRLIGCCIELEEKLLIYEYLENKSLDSILFKKDKSSMLDWEKRFNIICGIARGLLYLHQDSRFRIIHRDLKASNILLDRNMNPKISDFGMARIFEGDQTEANTKRVVGTYGYMSPEYAMDGLISIKSDVFSFGVLVLEIVSGKKNRGFYQTNNQLNLLAYAWKLYREARVLELIDRAAGESYSGGEVMRCVQVGLLCVQEHAQDRPNMSAVMLMLSSDCASIPQPTHPGYCLGRRPVEFDSSVDDESCTVNRVTVTMLDGR